jgi:hypothetical protein
VPERNALGYGVAVIGEFLQDRLINLVGKHGRLAVARVRDNLDRLLFIYFRVLQALLDAFHGVGEDVCYLRVRCKVVAFEADRAE